MMDRFANFARTHHSTQNIASHANAGSLAQSEALHVRFEKIPAETGACCCLQPVKSPNGRLMWAADSAERLMGGAA
jgi:predicted metal-dependent enzyme (double-stranded beta helix superfamily)